MDGLTTLEVVEDFFDLNNLEFFLSKLDAVREKIRIPAPGSTASPSSSPEGTSPGATKSSGGSPPENANPSPDTATVM
jgi:hypothetical protein